MDESYTRPMPSGPTGWFMTRVLMLSMGAVVRAHMNPANMDETKWRVRPSGNHPLSRT